MRLFLLFLGITFFAPIASAESTNNKTCSTTPCDAGTKAITYATTQEPYHACPTRELAQYTATVEGLSALVFNISGKIPNISDKTGEPEFTGETKAMLDGLRKKAGVTTYDQAIAKCTVGADKVKVMVLNNPSDLSVIYVTNEKAKTTFWMPKGSLDKR